MFIEAIFEIIFEQIPTNLEFIRAILEIYSEADLLCKIVYYVYMWLVGKLRH